MNEHYSLKIDTAGYGFLLPKNPNLSLLEKIGESFMVGVRARGHEWVQDKVIYELPLHSTPFNDLGFFYLSDPKTALYKSGPELTRVENSAALLNSIRPIDDEITLIKHPDTSDWSIHPNYKGIVVEVTSLDGETALAYYPNEFDDPDDPFRLSDLTRPCVEAVLTPGSKISIMKKVQGNYYSAYPSILYSQISEQEHHELEEKVHLTTSQ